MVESIGELTSAALVQQMDTELAARAEQIHNLGRLPQLAILTDNTDHAPSQRYMHIKELTAGKVGIGIERLDIPHTDGLVDALGYRQEHGHYLDGIIVQLPLREPGRTEEVLSLIDPAKDVDGLGPDAPHMPATPMAIVRLLEHYDINPLTEKVALLGQGRLVGKPLLRYLTAQGAMNVTPFDDTSDPLEIVSGLEDADIIITAMGLPDGLTNDLFEDHRPRTLVDVGAAEVNGKVVGDISDELRASALARGWNVTPRLGGVGPVTVRVLLENTLDSAEQRLNQQAA